MTDQFIRGALHSGRLTAAIKREATPQRIAQQISTSDSATVVRVHRRSTIAEPMREATEAKEAASEVAERIKEDDPEGEDAHGALDHGSNPPRSDDSQ